MFDDTAATMPQTETPRDYTVGDLQLSVARHECRLHGRPVALTPTEFAILRILLEQDGAVISAEELCRRIWNDER